MKRLFASWKLWLFLIMLLAAILRLYKLGTIPYGLSNDEASYIYSSYSIWHTAKSVQGQLLPLSFNLDGSYSPVYIYFGAPFVGLLGLTPFVGILPYTLMSLGSVLMVFFLVDELFKNKSLALLSTFVLAISPWHLQISRGAWDPSYALFFYLLAIFLFIKFIQKGNIIWSLPTFLLAYYSYHAIKIFFILFAPILIALYWKELLKKKKQLIFFVLGYFAIIFSFVLVIYSQNVTRQSELLTHDPNLSYIIGQERSTSTAPKIFQTIFNNKVFYYLRVFRENYLDVFSTNYLFTYGDTTASGPTLNIFYRGEMYIIELPLLLLGCYFLLQEKSWKKKGIIFGGLLVAPLSSAITYDKAYVTRDAMMLPFLAILVGIGIYMLVTRIPKQKQMLKRLSVIILISLYTILFSSYLYQYYFRYPQYGAEGSFRNFRTVAEYIRDNNIHYRNVEIGHIGKFFLLEYAVFAQLNPKLVQATWNKSDLHVQNITIVDKCPQLPPQTQTLSTQLIITSPDCYPKIKPSDTIVDYGNSQRVLWNIYKR